MYLKKQVQRPLSDFPSIFPALILPVSSFSFSLLFNGLGVDPGFDPLKHGSPDGTKENSV